MKIFKLIAASMAVIVLGAIGVQAQPWGTNSGSQFGAYLPNASVPAVPLSPLTTQLNQYKLGIVTGTSVTGSTGYATNTFPTNYVYSLPPSVQIEQTGSTWTTTNVVTSVTTTNFILFTGVANITNAYTVIGQ